MADLNAPLSTLVSIFTDSIIPWTNRWYSYHPWCGEPSAHASAQLVDGGLGDARCTIHVSMRGKCDETPFWPVLKVKYPCVEGDFKRGSLALNIKHPRVIWTLELHRYHPWYILYTILIIMYFESKKGEW